MFLSFATVVTILSVFTGALSAPINQPVGISWNSIKEGSLKLNHLAKRFLIEEFSHLKTVETDVKMPRVVVEASDKCDPTNLRVDSMPCFRKMVSALKNYRTVFGTISQFKKNCKNVGTTVSNVVTELLIHMKESSPEENWSTVHSWEEAGLCHDSLEKLFSFSILMARVFAPGDPAKHTM
ncbi:hypothetical protein DPEC_G00011670 [Dallia pectoralis]|uniref:Uncharacterized protein n=1 Tax=Dallia pectoralis TaxID=75939 RepID=A0ACC2HLJ9_DALPE|nr:hypothetical protein DPEC_G00011670 [Dallia pectoralis]